MYAGLVIFALNTLVFDIYRFQPLFSFRLLTSCEVNYLHTHEFTNINTSGNVSNCYISNIIKLTTPLILLDMLFSTNLSTP